MAGPLRGVRVLVAGAGLAGLTAARELSRQGASVHVFEARERLGGRVWTWRGDPLAPFHAELGGELIEQEHTALRRLCRELHLPLARILHRGFGLAIARDERVQVVNDQTTIWKRFASVFRPHADALEAAGRSWSSSAASAVALRSMASVLDDARVRGPVRELAVGLRNLYGADPDDLSALIAADAVLDEANPSELTAYRVRGGADRIIGALAATRGCTVDLRHVVRSLKQDERGVTLTVETPRGRRVTVAADFAVVAVPCPLLKDLGISPALPEPQRVAIETLGFGHATKVILRFTTAWWRQHRSRPRAFATNLPIGAVWDASEDQPLSALLTLLGCGRASGSLRSIADEEGGDGLAHRLRWLAGGPREAPAVHRVTWEDDPWAKGGYSYFGPRFDPALQPLLGRAHGRVCFAGSHTSREFLGYMNGAVESGVRAAEDILTLARLD